MEVFKHVDAVDIEDEDNMNSIEFADFMKAISTYCFFGKEEILRYLPNNH